MMRALRWPRRWLGLWLAAVLVVIVASLVPPPGIAMTAPQGSDKLAHFLAYFALGFGAIQLFASARLVGAVGGGLALLGLALEWAQGALLPELRTFDWNDALANALGVLAALALWPTAVARLLQRLEGSWRGRP